MEVTERQEGDLLIVRLDGELDAYWSGETREKLFAHLERGWYRMVLDLGGLAYLSSAGLRVLLQLQQRIGGRKGELALAAAQPFVQEVLSSSGFSRALKMYDTVELALAALRGDAPRAAAPGAPAGEVAQERVTAAGTFQFRAGESGAARLRVWGQADDLLYSRASGGQLKSVPLGEDGFTLGVGAMGELHAGSEAAILDRLGELLGVPGAAYWLPGDGRQVPDFMLAKDAGPNLRMHLLYGLTLSGPARIRGRFTAADYGAGAELGDVAAQLLEWASRQTDYAGIIGFVLRAETAGMWGVALKRAPRADRAPADHQRISHRENIKDWLHFTTEPTHANHTAVIVGLVVDLKRTLLPPERLRAALGASNGGTRGVAVHTHAHAAVFRFMPELGGESTPAQELAHLTEQGELAAVAHLLPPTRLRKGAFEVWMVDRIEE